MIVREFLHWARVAAAGDRADATAALARAYLHADLSEEDRAAAEGAMAMMLDDPSPLVRRALAEALADAGDAPLYVVLALAADQPEIAAIVLEHSPLLCDADLVDAVGGGDPVRQLAVARRCPLPAPVAAAIAEVGTAEACLTLIENPAADIPAFSLHRIAARHGRHAALREALLARDDLPASTRQTLVRMLAEVLVDFVASRGWIEESRVRSAAKEACEKAAVAIAASSADGEEVRSLIVHLQESGELTAGLVLRALLSGHLLLFEEVLAELSGLPLARVSALVHDRRGAAFRALYDRAGLPASAFPAFRAALDALHEAGFVDDPAASAALKRRMVERVLTRCEHEASGEIEPLLCLLRRFAVEAAREEARRFCSELMAA